MVDAPAARETKWSPRSGAIYCLLAWATIWLFFLAVRFSGFDIRQIPGIGPVMLLLFSAVAAAPLAASLLAVVAVIQRPASTLSWITLVCAIAALVGQAVLFAASKWM